MGLNVENLIGLDVSSCSEEGKMETSRACPKFTQDPTTIRDLLEEDFEDGIREMASLMKSMNPKQLLSMAGMFINEATTRKAGFHAWQPVYVRFRGTANSNYMSNFMTARVINADKNKVRLVSDDGKVVLSYANTGNAGPSLYSVENFEPLKEEMIDKGKRVDETERATPKRLRSEELQDVDLELNTDGLNGRISKVGKVVRSNKVARRAKAESNVMDLTKIAQQIEGGTSFVEYDEDSGEYTMPSHKYTKGKRRNLEDQSEIELGDLK